MIGFPKPASRLEDRVAKRRARDLTERAFRLAVWLRDGGRCRHCGRRVIHAIEAVPERGEVHHRRGRNVTPADRFNVDEAVLLCLRHHRDPHVVAQFRRRVT